MKPTVYIVGSALDYAEMFTKRGWDIAAKINGANLIQFTGGEDVSPYLYDEMPLPSTYSNPIRDRAEQVIFNLALKLEIPMAGICRGGQFLNIMCGGKMWQHVDKHAINGTHAIHDIETNEVFQGTSTHHQMMRPSSIGQIIAVAHISTYRECCQNGKSLTLMSKACVSGDPEIIYYTKQNALCFQPHPELYGYNDLANTYFKYLAKYLNFIPK